MDRDGRSQRKKSDSTPAAGSTGSSDTRPGTAGMLSRTRDPLLDNARAILIVLVVVGHALEQLDTPPANILYTWIYSFHMPAFVIISGFLSRSYRNEPRQISRLLTGLVLPYLIFQVLHSLEQDLLRGNELDVSLWHPAWTLWFLLALTAWRLMTPVLRALRYPLIFAVAISVIAPLDADLDTVLSWGRILSMLPYFTLGLLCTPERLDSLRRVPRSRLLGAALLLGALAFAALTHEMFSTSVFTMSMSYEAREMSWLYGALTRVMALAAGVVLTVALLMVTPRRQRWFTVIGVRSLTVYLLHSMVVEFPRQLGWFDDLSGVGPTLLITLGGVLLTLVLASTPVVRGLSWLTSPPVGALLVREAPTRAR